MLKAPEDRTWTRGLSFVLAGSLALGLGVGLTASLLKIFSNRFIEYHMGRLALITLGHLVNQSVSIFVAVSLLLFCAYRLIPLKSEKSKNRFVWFGWLVVLVVMGWLLVEWYAVPIATLPVWVRRTAEETLRLLGGRASLNHFLAYLRNRLAAGSLLIAIVGGIVALAWLMGRINLLGIARRWQRHTWRHLVAGLAIALAILNLGTWVDQSINMPGGYNVILIGIDTWRADHLSSFGYDRLTMPSVDTLASQGFRFINAYSTTSWTLPSFLSILTSLYQSSHGVVSSEYKLAPCHVTLAEILRNEGYSTAGFISGTYLKRTFGFDQGFDKYEESVTSAQLIKTYDDVTSARVTRLVEDWLRSNYTRPFFIFAHYWDPHFDYIPPAPFDTIFDPDYTGKIDGRNFMSNPEVRPDMDPRDLSHIVALYDGELRWTDSNLSHLFRTLEDLGILDRTIIVLVGDHGEEFFEHGGKGHRNTLYNEVIHVPIVFWLPRIQGRVVQTPVSTVDIVPTILDLIGIEPPQAGDGISLTPLMGLGSSDTKPPRGRPIYSELSTFLACMIRGDWKIIHDSKANTWELYDIATDYGETTNLAAEMPDTLANLRSELLHWLDSQRRRRPARSRARQDAETRRQLKALGYIQ